MVVVPGAVMVEVTSARELLATFEKVKHRLFMGVEGGDAVGGRGGTYLGRGVGGAELFTTSVKHTAAKEPQGLCLVHLVTSSSPN